jgi:hypothetical protein
VLIASQKSAQEVLVLFDVLLGVFQELVELFPNNQDQKLLEDSF